MAKKDFTQVLKESEKKAEGLMSLLGEAPQKVKQEKKKETRATFVISVEILHELKHVAYWERKTQKELLEEALLDLFNKYPIKEYRDEYRD